MNTVRIAGIDPGFRNFAVARMTLDLQSLELSIEDLILLKTEGMASKDKTLRKNSDDLRRARELRDGFHAAVEGCAIGFAEIPSGAQDARANYSFGLCLGLIASAPIPILQVQNFEAKMIALGTKTGSKEEMIDWAFRQWPDAAWLTRKLKGQTLPTAANEHLADACAIASAGVRLQEFKATMALWKSVAVAA